MALKLCLSGPRLNYYIKIVKVVVKTSFGPNWHLFHYYSQSGFALAGMHMGWVIRSYDGMYIYIFLFTIQITLMGLFRPGFEL